MKVIVDGVEAYCLPDCAHCNFNNKYLEEFDECPLGNEYCFPECWNYSEEDTDNVETYLASYGEEFTEDEIDQIIEAVEEGASIDGAIINVKEAR